MNPRNRFFILLSVIFVIALGYYFFSTPSTKDLVLIGTVDSNQVIVSPQTQGRLQKLMVDEGTPVKAGDLIGYLGKTGNAASTSPQVNTRCSMTLLPFSSKISGVPGAAAVVASTTAGSGS